MLLCVLSAFAADTSIGLSAAGEAILDDALNDHFHATSLGGELYATFPLPVQLEGKIATGYRRLTGLDGVEYIWYVPISATVGFAVPVGRLSLFADLGPTYVLWGNTPSDDPKVGDSGGNFGAMIEGGARYPTMLLQPSLHHPDAKIGGLDIVGSVGLRWNEVHMGAPKGGGLDFSALRLNLGVAARF